jgi:DNA-binding NarL/FixJ family response regulator
MTRAPRTGRVIAVAREAMEAARVEAALRDLSGWRIEVGRPAQLPALRHDCPDAIVVTALADGETRRALRVAGASSRRLVLVALCDHPARLWTPASRALGLGAALPRTATAEELVAAVRAVHAGLLVAHPDALAPVAADSTAAAPGGPLTAREREILELMVDGASNRAIAARLAISRHTAKFHVASILAKLGARSRTEAVARALRAGLLAV